MTLGVSGGDYIFNNYLSSFARQDKGFFAGGSVTLSGGSVMYSSSGTYLINGSYYSNSGAYLTFAVGSTVPRIDLVFATGTSYVVRAGAYPSATERPNPPQILNWELPVAHVTVGSNVSTLSNSDARDVQQSMPINSATSLNVTLQRAVMLGIFPREETTTGDVTSGFSGSIANGATFDFQPAAGVTVKITGAGSTSDPTGTAPEEVPPVDAELYNGTTSVNIYDAATYGKIWFRQPIFINNTNYLRLINVAGVNANVAYYGIRLN